MTQLLEGCESAKSTRANERKHLFDENYARRYTDENVFSLMWWLFLLLLLYLMSLLFELLLFPSLLSASLLDEEGETGA